MVGKHEIIIAVKKYIVLLAIVILLLTLFSRLSKDLANRDERKKIIEACELRASMEYAELYQGICGIIANDTKCELDEEAAARVLEFREERFTACMAHPSFPPIPSPLGG